jgi:hypothetical protein
MPVRMWMPTGILVPLRQAPVNGQSEMVRLQPTKTLSNGIYALFEEGFDGAGILRPRPRTVHIFEVTGHPEAPADSWPPVEVVPLRISRAVIAAGINEGIGFGVDMKPWEILTEQVPESEPYGVRNQFSPGAVQIVCYVETTNEKAGQGIEFVWIQPGGFERNRSSSTVPGTARRGETYYTFSRFRPTTVLEPGSWRVDIYVDGALAKHLPFTVGSANGFPKERP